MRSAATLVCKAARAEASEGVAEEKESFIIAVLETCLVSGDKRNRRMQD